MYNLGIPESIPGEDELTVQDWTNISTALDICTEVLGEQNPDVPLPDNLDETVRRVRLAAIAEVKKHPEELVELLRRLVGKSSDNTNTPEV